jgi:hypothetical protein
VFAVWEPILPTDWGKPGTSILQRLSDRRIQQFWDAQHVVATALKRAEAAGGPRPNCCERKGILWDLFAVYAPGLTWNDNPPQPVLFNGAVAPAIAELDSAIAKTR